MTEPTPDADSSADEKIDPIKLGEAIRFAFAALILPGSFFSLSSSLAIDKFQGIYADMLNGMPLPAMTRLVIAGKPLFILLAVAVPFAVMGTLFLRRRLAFSFYLLGGLAFLAIGQTVFTIIALCVPLLTIIQKMGGG